MTSPFGEADLRLQQLYAQEFAQTVEFDCETVWHNEEDLQKSRFGISFADMLEHMKVSMPADSSEPLSVLDIGTGREGTFLKAAADRFGEKVRPVGFNAVPQPGHTGAIEWVYGDFLRDETWSRPEQMADESFDLIFSNLTFHLLADPFRALDRAYRLLKPGGEMYIDRLRTAVLLTQMPLMKPLITDVLEECFDATATIKDAAGGISRIRGLAGYGAHELCVDQVHARKNGRPRNKQLMSQLVVSGVVDDAPARAIYTRAQ